MLTCIWRLNFVLFAVWILLLNGEEPTGLLQKLGQTRGNILDDRTGGKEEEENLYEDPLFQLGSKEDQNPYFEWI